MASPSAAVVAPIGSFCSPPQAQPCGGSVWV